MLKNTFYEITLKKKLCFRSNLEEENELPDKAEYDPVIAICDVRWIIVDKFESESLQLIERYRQVGYMVHSL